MKKIPHFREAARKSYFTPAPLLNSYTEGTSNSSYSDELAYDNNTINSYATHYPSYHTADHSPHALITLHTIRLDTDLMRSLPRITYFFLVFLFFFFSLPSATVFNFGAMLCIPGKNGYVQQAL